MSLSTSEQDIKMMCLLITPASLSQHRNRTLVMSPLQLLLLFPISGRTLVMLPTPSVCFSFQHRAEHS